MKKKSFTWGCSGM